MLYYEYPIYSTKVVSKLTAEINNPCLQRLLFYAFFSEKMS